MCVCVCRILCMTTVLITSVNVQYLSLGFDVHYRYESGNAIFSII